MVVPVTEVATVPMGVSDGLVLMVMDVSPNHGILMDVAVMTVSV